MSDDELIIGVVLGVAGLLILVGLLLLYLYKPSCFPKGKDPEKGETSQEPSTENGHSKGVSDPEANHRNSKIVATKDNIKANPLFGRHDSFVETFGEAGASIDFTPDAIAGEGGATPQRGGSAHDSDESNPPWKQDILLKRLKKDSKVSDNGSSTSVGYEKPGEAYLNIVSNGHLAESTSSSPDKNVRSDFGSETELQGLTAIDETARAEEEAAKQAAEEAAAKQAEEAAAKKAAEEAAAKKAGEEEETKTAEQLKREERKRKLRQAREDAKKKEWETLCDTLAIIDGLEG